MTQFNKIIQLSDLSNDVYEFTEEGLKFGAILPDRIKGSFSTLMRRFSAFFKQSNAELKDSVIQPLPTRTRISIVDPNTTVTIPFGLNVYLIDLIKALDTNQQHFNDLHVRLEMCSREVAQYVSNPDLLNSITGSDVYGKLTSLDLDKVKSSVADCFSSNQTDTKRLIDVVRSQGEFDDCVKQFNALLAQFSKVPAHRIVELVNQLDELVESIVAEVNNGNITNKRRINDLAKMVFIIAHDVEAYALHAFNIDRVRYTITVIEKKSK